MNKIVGGIATNKYILYHLYLELFPGFIYYFLRSFFILFIYCLLINLGNVWFVWVKKSSAACFCYWCVQQFCLFVYVFRWVLLKYSILCLILCSRTLCLSIYLFYMIYWEFFRHDGWEKYSVLYIFMCFYLPLILIWANNNWDVRIIITFHNFGV